MSKHTDSCSGEGVNPLRGADKASHRPTRTEPGLRANSSEAKCDRVKKFLQAVTFVVRHHGAPVKVVNSLNSQWGDYLRGVDEETFLKRAKYLILAPMARYLRNDPPAEPDLPFVARGAWLRWSRARLRCYRNKNTHLWYSLLQAKRGAEAVSPGIVLANFRKHRMAMLAPDPIGEEEADDEFLDSLLEGIQPILKRLSILLERDLGAYFDSPGDNLTQVFSTKASFESSRSKGGAAGFARRIIRKIGQPLQDGLRTMKHHVGRRVKGKTLVHDPVVEVRHYPDELEALRVIAERETELEDIPVYSAQVEAVLEPFKVRVISKGPSVPYFLARPVQKALHSRMRRLNPFLLIGRPAYASDLMRVREAQERIGLGPEEHWLSIDYSAATDGLSASLSSEIMQRLLGRLALRNLGLYRLMLGVLAPHLVHYPRVLIGRDAETGKPVYEALDPVLQRNGQLMGSILSFPILCLANLALYLAVRRKTRPNASLKDLLAAVLVNGDDMIYIGTREEWDLHIALGERMGLRISPGKAYIHRRYANINSISFEYDLGRSGNTPERIGFLNVGLMVGNHKVMGKVGSSDEPKEAPFSTVVDEVVRGAWKGKQVQVLSQYLSMHKADISQEAKGRNLFLPVSAGGLGATAPAGFKFYITPEQLKWAAGIRKRYPYLVPAERPMPEGKEIREVSDHLYDPIREPPQASERTRRPPKGLMGTARGALFGFVPYALSSRK